MIPLSGASKKSRQEMTLAEAKSRIKALEMQINNVNQHNETLFNCWLKATKAGNKAAMRHREKISEKNAVIKKLQAQITQLKAHLNPL